MTRAERNRIKKWAKGLSNEELEKEYYNITYDSLGSLTDRMYELGYDIQDIIEREKYEKLLLQKADILAMLCEERGIKLWNI